MMKLKTLLLFLTLSAVPIVAIAQQVTSDAPTDTTKLSDTVPTTALVEILTAPLNITELPVNQPVELDMSLLNIPNGATDLAQGVVAKGYARSVEVEGKTIGQVVLTGVAKGEKQEALNSTVFTSQFDMSESTLKPDQPIKIMGNGPELVEALKRLQAEPAKEEDKAQDQVAQAQSPEGTSSGESGNPDAAGYQSPEPIQKAANPVETTVVTTEGCQIRVDEQQKTAFVQSKTQNLKDGVVQSEDACSDSQVSYKLEKSYANCKGQDIIDLTATPPTATAQFQWYYVDGGGTNQTYGDCQSDPELVFTIVEKHGSCPIYLDYSAGAEKAVFQSKLIYMNQSNKEELVQDCAASVEKPAVPMVQSTSPCQLRHDYAPVNKSFRQAVWTYQSDGVSYQAGNCLDDGTEYPHVKTYKDDAGNYLCSPINNGSTVTLLSRMKITVNGLSQYVTECTPDTTNIAIQSTTQDCTNPANWEHNLTTAQSFGQERFYFVHEGKEVPVTSCQNSTTTYTHEVETTGWQDHDDQKFAYPLTTVYITTPTGRYDIKTSEVLQGAQQMPYTFQKFDVVASGAPTYEGCNKLQPYDNVKVWKRPAGTLHNEVTGTASPTSSNACQKSGNTLVEWTLSKEQTRDSCFVTKSGGIETYYGATYRDCWYSSTVKVTRDDNTLISSNTYEEQSSQTQASSRMITYAGGGLQGDANNGCRQGSGAGTPPACPANPTIAEFMTWQAKYGF